MKENTFLHWHIHFEGSKFDGLVTPDEAEADILLYDKPCFAITDHGTMISALSLHNVCKKYKKKFIPGAEMYVVNSIDEKLDGPRKRKFDKKRHIVLLAKNEIGFKNIIYLDTLANMFFFMKPRVCHQNIFDKNEGIIVTTACMGGIIASPYLWDDESTEAEREANATKIAFQYREVFGDRFFLEIQPTHDKNQLKLNSFLISLHKRYGFNLIATNDVHYAKREHYKYHCSLIAIQNRNKQEGDNDLKYEDGHYLRNWNEMIEAFESNGTSQIDRVAVHHAMHTANAIEKEFEGVVIEKKVKIPEYKDAE